MLKMILIRRNDIENWNIIKENHKEYFRSKVKYEIQNEIPKDKSSKKYLLFKELFLNDQNNVDDKKILEIAIGNKKALDQIIRKYKDIINEDDENLYKVINKFINARCRKVEKIINILKELNISLKTGEQEYFYKFIENPDENMKNIEKRKEIIKNSRIGKRYNEICGIQQSLEKIFDYEKSFGKNGITIKKTIKWNRDKLLSMMGISVCPYCNRQYINKYNAGNKHKTTADLDHFYPKSKYTFLALSLYNFIPSCQICNSRFKGDEDFYKGEYIYPYEEEFGDEAKFRTDFYMDEDIKDKQKQLKEEDAYDITYLLGNSNNFKIKIDIKDSESEIGKKIDNSKNIFHLEDLYNAHKDYVRELIKKAIIYNESRIDELYTQYPELFNSREEVLQMVVSNYIDANELGKRPLSKLTKDICDELGLK